MKPINENTAANTAAALNIKINRAKRTIEISKTFEKAVPATVPMSTSP